MPQLKALHTYIHTGSAEGTLGKMDTGNELEGIAVEMEGEELERKELRHITCMCEILKNW